MHLDKNQLGEVPTEALEGLPALLELQLSGNPLGALRDGAFRPVGPSLQHLFLNSSGLEQVGAGEEGRGEAAHTAALPRWAPCWAWGPEMSRALRLPLGAQV